MPRVKATKKEEPIVESEIFDEEESLPELDIKQEDVAPKKSNNNKKQQLIAELTEEQLAILSQFSNRDLISCLWHRGNSLENPNFPLKNGAMNLMKTTTGQIPGNTRDTGRGNFGHSVGNADTPTRRSSSRSRRNPYN